MKIAFKAPVMWDTKSMGWVQLAKALTPPVVWHALYRHLVVGKIEDADCYAPHFSPWLKPEFLADFAKVQTRTLCDKDSCWTIVTLLKQALHLGGDVAEAGVYKGGTAMLIKQAMLPPPRRETSSPGEFLDGYATDGARHDAARKLYLFDSFAGFAEVDAAQDRFQAGDLGETSLEDVKRFVGQELFINYRPGWMPDSFQGLEARRFCFVHVDVDLYASVLACCEFFYGRLQPGGVMVFHDYGFPSCPGARKAIDTFFADKPEEPLVLQTGQVVVSKLPTDASRDA